MFVSQALTPTYGKYCLGLTPYEVSLPEDSILMTKIKSCPVTKFNVLLNESVSLENGVLSPILTKQVYLRLIYYQSENESTNCRPFKTAFRNNKNSSWSKFHR